MNSLGFLQGGTAAICRICSSNYSSDSDRNDYGWFCDNCDSFTSFDGDYPLFKVILEDKGSEVFIESPEIKLKKHLSPLRYPGGKSKFIDYLYSSIKDMKVNRLVSPYTGGTVLSLMTKITESLHCGIGYSMESMKILLIESILTIHREMITFTFSPLS